MTNVRVASLSVDNSQARAAMAETEAGMRKVGDAAASVGQTTEKEKARLNSYGREWQGVEKRMAGSAESLRKFEAMQGFAARAVEAGRITQEQATEAVEKYRLKLVAGAAAAERAAKAQEVAAQASARAAMEQARAVDALSQQMNAGYAAQVRYAQKQQEVIDLHVAGALNGRQFAAAMKFVADSYDPVAIAARKAADEQVRSAEAAAAAAAAVSMQQARAVDQLRQQIDPAYAAQARFAAEQQKVIDLYVSGALNGRQFAAAMTSVADSYDPAIISAKEAATENTRLALSYQQVMAGIDPAIAAEQRYGKALTDLRVGAAAAGRSAADLAADEARLAAVMSPAAIAAQKEADALEALKARTDPAAAALRRLAEDQKALDAARAAGKLNPEEYTAYTAAVARHRTMVEQSTVSQKAMTNAVGLTKAQMAGLTPQINDVVSGLIMGQPPMMIFAQQSGQFVQALQAGGAEMPKFTLGMGLMAGGVAAGVAAFAAVVYGASRFSDEIRSLERTIALTGNASGVTADQIVGMSDVLAESSNVSRSTAREIQTAYVATGKIGGQMLVSLTEQTRNWALATGQDTDKAAAELAGMFSDPAKAAADLTAKYGMLDPAQVKLIKNYQAQGELGKAQQVLFDGMAPRITDAAKNVSALAEAWEWASRGISNFIDAGGRGFASKGPSVADLKARADKAATAYAADPTGYDWVNGAKVTSKELADLTAAAYAEAFRNADADSWFAAIKAGDADFRKLQGSVSDFAASVDPAQAAAQAYTNRQVDMDKAVKAGAVSQAEATRLLGLYKAQLLDTMSPMQAFAQDAERQARALDAHAGVARQVEQRRQDELKRRGLKPGDALPQRAEDAIYDGVSQVDAAQGRDRVRILDETAAAQARLNRAQISGNPREIAKATTELSIAQRRAGGETITAAESQRLYGRAADQVSSQIDAQLLQMGLQADAADRMAEAAGKGEAAQRRANIETQAAAADLKGLGLETRMFLEMQEAAAARQIHSEFAAGINLEVAANDRLVKGMTEGAQAWRDAEAYTAAYAQTLREVPYPEAGEDTEDWNRRLQDNIDLIEKQKKSLDSKAFADYGETIKANTRQLQLQQQLIGATPQQSARLKVEYDINEMLRKEKTSYDSMDADGKARIDNLRDQALANADIEQTIARQQDAWNTLTGSLEKAFERVGDAIVEAFAKGEMKSIDWGNVTKAVIASLMSDLLKMAAINPLSNALFGTNKGTIWDLGGSSGQPAAGQNTAGGASLSNIASAAQSGYSALTGSTASTFANAGTWFAESAAGHAAGLSTAYPMMTGGVSGPAVQSGTIYAANAQGASLSSGLGAIGAAAPYGMLGGVGGAYLSNNYMGGSKVGGALTGAALGVGTYAAGTAITGALGMGAAASAAGVSGMAGATAALSAIPVYGWIAAAAIAAITAALGSQKPSVGPNAQGNVVYEDGRYVQGPSAADNGGDDSNVKNVTAAVSQGFNALADAYGIKLKEQNYGYWEGGTDAATGNGVHNDPKELIRKILGDATASDPNSNVAKALANSTVKASGDLEEIQKYLDVASKIDNATEAFKELNKSLAQVQASAKTAAADGFKSIDEEIKTADKIGLGAAYRDSLEDSIRSTFEGAVKSATPWETAMAQLRGETDAWIEAVTRWSVGVSEAEIRADAAAKATKLRQQAMEEYNTALYQAQGRDYLTNLSGIASNRDAVRRNLTAVGVDDPSGKANTLVSAQLTSVLSGLNLAQLTDVTKTLGGEIGALAETMRVAAQATATEDLTVRALRGQGKTAQADDYERGLKNEREYQAAVTAGMDKSYLAGLRYVQWLDNVAVATDRATAAQAAALASQERSAGLAARIYTILGDPRQATMVQLQVQQQRELSDARAAGATADQLATLQAVQYSEAQKSNFEQNRTMLLAAYDREINAQQELVTSLQSGAVAAAQAARQFKQAFDSLAINDNSPLSPLLKLEEARRQFEDAYATAKSGTATADEKTAAQSTLQSLGPTLIGLAQGYFASSSTTDYDRVRSVYAEFGDLQAQGLDTADQQLSVAQDQLKELQRQRASYADLGNRQIASIDQLRASTDASYAEYQRTVSAFADSLAAANSATKPVAPDKGGTSAAQQAGEWMTNWFSQYDVYTARNNAGQLSQDEWQSQGAALFQGKVNKANELPLDPTIWNAFIAAAAAGSDQGRTAAWLRQVAHDKGVPGYALGGIVSNGTWNQDSVTAMLAGGEHITRAPSVNAETMPVLDWINRTGSLPANDRWSGVAEYRVPRPASGGGDGSVAIVSALREEIRSLKDEVSALRATTAGGAMAVKGAVEVGNGHAADMASAARRQATAPKKVA